MVEKKCTMVLYCPSHGQAFQGRELPLNWRQRRCDTCRTHLMILDIDCNPRVYQELARGWAEPKALTLSLYSESRAELRPLQYDPLGCRVAGVLTKAYATKRLKTPLRDLTDEELLGLPHFGLKMLARLRQEIPAQEGSKT